MRRGIRFAEVVDVVGRDQLETGPLRQFGHPGIHLGQFADARLLHLEIDVLFAEYPHQPLYLSIGRRELPVLQSPRQPAARATAETDQPPGMLLEQLVVDAWLVVVAFEKGKTAQLQQIAVAGVVSGQESQMPALLALTLLVKAIFDHVGLETDDGLDAGFAALFVELDHPGEHSVIGDGQGPHAQFLGEPHQVLHPAGPVERRVVSMDVQVAETGLRTRAGRLDLL